MLKTILIGGLAVSLISLFFNNGNNRLRSSGSKGPRIRYGPQYLPPGVPNGEEVSTEPYFRIILASNVTAIKKTSPGRTSVPSNETEISNNVSTASSSTPIPYTTSSSENITTTRVPITVINVLNETLSINSTMNEGAALTSSTLQSISKEPLTGEEIGAQEISKGTIISTPNTQIPTITKEQSSASTSRNFDYTTVSYIKLRNEEIQGENFTTIIPVSTSFTPLLQESNYRSTFANEETTVSGYYVKTMQREQVQQAKISQESVTEYYKTLSSTQFLIPNETIPRNKASDLPTYFSTSRFPPQGPITSTLVYEQYEVSLKPITENKANFQSTSPKILVESATEGSFTLKTTSATQNNKPLVIVETVTEYNLPNSAEIKNPVQESINYLPPRPGLSLKLPNNQSISTESRNQSSLISNQFPRNYSAIRPSDYYLPPRA